MPIKWLIVVKNTCVQDITDCAVRYSAHATSNER